MTTTIGVRELKNQASRILRQVREIGAEYIVTVDGTPVAVIRPYTEADSEQARQARVQKFLAEMEVLAQEIGAEWQSNLSAAEAVAEQRR
ncbi:MAG: type II toxin-antitoxin system Phd/YefM family antitoxin [Anaerolineae bacterium]|nr:type II toxin-antitoxin system Phd/YefM family antitoxin [Anaerolineae bacterium]